MQRNSERLMRKMAKKLVRVDSEKDDELGNELAYDTFDVEYKGDGRVYFNREATFSITNLSLLLSRFELFRRGDKIGFGMKTLNLPLARKGHYQQLSPRAVLGKHSSEEGYRRKRRELGGLRFRLQSADEKEI
ncbi:hypothetical protein KIN20_019022 [Parelaphostrongylus tenuis]|uniref:Uncharacterized protein n=1 Tax=Parelaphostrongylus tenuis TaxID=148309 RepID=A0AAD5N4X7_PARTN|nr:hypothetical protein KIN20_019022 [Parelaphostrongylus tenuis]